MAVEDDARSLVGVEVYDSNGNMIGRAEEVYVDGATARPAWVLLSAGIFRAHPVLAPLHGATMKGPTLRLAYHRDRIDAAPPPPDAADQPVPAEHVDALHRHYNLPEPQPTEQPGDSGDDAMTRAEERLTVHTAPEPTERVRLRRYVETDYVQVTVPVRREKVRLEREPARPDTDEGTPEAVTDDDSVTTQSPEGAEGHDIILHEERPIITMQTVPVERVRLTKETVDDTTTVESQVRSERIDVDLPGEETRPLD